MRLSDWAECGRANGWIVRRGINSVEMRRGDDAIMVTRRTIKVNGRDATAAGTRQLVERINSSDS